MGFRMEVKNEKDESFVRYRNESRIGICEIKMRLVTRSLVSFQGREMT